MISKMCIMKPLGSFYKGENFFINNNFPFPRSDILFHAIISSWKVIYGEKDYKKLIDSFLSSENEENLPFYISSVFPCINNVYFLPCPLNFEINTTIKQKVSDRLISQISWISINIYKKWLNEENIPWNIDCFIYPSLYCDVEEKDKIKINYLSKYLWEDDKGRMRNNIDPFTTLVDVFPANQIWYNPDLEWYFFINFKDEEYEEKVDKIFRYLEDVGIGGRRGVGSGSFNYKGIKDIPSDMDFITKPAEEYFITLSLYYPTQEDVEKGILDESIFDLVERQGWRRDKNNKICPQKKLRLLKEGSYFHFKEKIRLQPLIDVTAENLDEKYYHYGYLYKIIAPGVKENE